MINQATVDLVKEFEGLRLKAYQDSAGVWTIGYGTTARAGLGIDPAKGMEITEAEAEWYLQKGLDKFAEEIRPMFTAPINENEFGAFVSLAYNIGTTAFKRSSALRYFNSGDKATAAKKILLWNKSGGKVLKGLVRRREAERELFLTPVPEDAGVVSTGRTHPAQSRTVQASVVAAGSACGTAATALGGLDSTAQYIILGFAGVIALMAIWIMRERLRHWANGVR